MASTTFYLREEKDDNKVMLEDKDLEVIGTPLIKYGDSTVIVQHIESGLWLSYKVSTTPDSRTKSLRLWLSCKVSSTLALYKVSGSPDSGSCTRSVGLWLSYKVTTLCFNRHSPPPISILLTGW